MYQISSRTWVIEDDDNIAFIHEGGGGMQVVIRCCADGDPYSRNSDSYVPNGEPYVYTESEIVVLGVRAPLALKSPVNP